MTRLTLTVKGAFCSSSSVIQKQNHFVSVNVKLLTATPRIHSITTTIASKVTLNNLLDIKFHLFCVAGWMVKSPDG